MKYYYIDPEVAGGYGDNTQADWNAEPPAISHFHHEFEGWMGDEILTCFPCYAVTTELANKIENHNLTGVRFDPVEISKSEQLQEWKPDLALPPFVRLVAEGKAGLDDFGMGSKPNRPILVVSERALPVLQSSPSRLMEATPYPGP